MPTNYEPLVLTTEPAYVGSAVSPTVDITETSDDVTVTITDFRGEHSYTVEKTDGAIADAEAAAANANAAATNADTKGQQAVDIATTAANNANAKAELADAAAANANTKAALADSKAALADTAAANADSKAAAANTAANTANTSASNADAKATAAQTAANAANSAASSANTAASNADTKAALANTAATNADNKAALANTAAENATAKAGLADEAATTANTAAAAADAAREAIQGDLAAKADAEGYYQLLAAGLADTLPTGDATLDTFAQRVSDHDGACRITSLRGNTIVESGDLVSANVEGVKSVGFNQWDEEWEVGTIIRETGANADGANYARTKNYIPVMPLADYYLLDTQGATLGFRFYDANKSYLGYTDGNNRSSTSTSVIVKMPANCRYFRFVNTSGNIIDITKIALNLSDPSRNGTYEPYREIIRDIPAATYFPDGLRGAGTAYDELDFVEHKAVTRIGVIDLGSLTWGYGNTSDSNAKRMSTTGLEGVIKPPASNAEVGNIVCAKYETLTPNQTYSKNVGISVTTTGDIYVYDPDYNTISSQAAFKEAMFGVMLYYELATPTETALPENLQATYPVETNGTESIVIPTGEQSAPPTMAIVYAYNADGVRDISQAIIANIEGATASTNYAIGGYFVHAGKLFKATSAIATGETITPGTNCTQTTVMAELVSLTA